MLRFLRRTGASENTEKLTVQQFIAIRNKGTLARRLIELVGLSKKRGKDTGKIGFKGSGIKLAATAAVRSKLSTAVSSTDSLGSYYLYFDSAPVIFNEDGVDIRTEEVVYRYWKIVDNKPLPDNVLETRFVTDGFVDWDTPIGQDGNPVFKIVREHICNAYDEDPLFRTSEISGDTLLFAPPGETVVYIRMTDAVRNIFANPGRYFKFLSSDKPILLVDGFGSIWPKSDPDSSRRFIRQVLAGCETDEVDRSLFDYSIDDRALLSEERIITSVHLYKHRVGRLLMRLTDEKLAREILLKVYEHKAPFEAESLASIPNQGFVINTGYAFWKKVVQDTFKGKIAVYCDNDYANREARQLYGLHVLGNGNLSFRNFLLRLGFPSTEDLVPKDINPHIVQLAYEDLSFEGTQMFEEAFLYYSKHLPEYAHIPFAFFCAKNEDDPVTGNLAGFAGSGDGRFKEIWIKVNSNGEFPSLGDLLCTLVHEARHCASQANDYERLFVSYADRDIVMGILRHEMEPYFDSNTSTRDWGSKVSPIFIPTPDELLELDLEDLKDPNK